MAQTGYSISRKVSMTFDEAEKKVRETLKGQGFGILTEIDVTKTLKEKINADFRRYKILGACNPSFAHLALSAETEIGVMMPCNVIVYEADGGGTVVAAVDPLASMGSVKNELLKPIAASVREKLSAAINGI